MFYEVQVLLFVAAAAMALAAFRGDRTRDRGLRRAALLGVCGVVIGLGLWNTDHDVLQSLPVQYVHHPLGQAGLALAVLSVVWVGSVHARAGLRLRT